MALDQRTLDVALLVKELREWFEARFGRGTQAAVEYDEQGDRIVIVKASALFEPPKAPAQQATRGGAFLALSRAERETLIDHHVRKTLQAHGAHLELQAVRLRRRGEHNVTALDLARRLVQGELERGDIPVEVR